MVFCAHGWCQRLLLIRDRHPRRVIVSALAGECRELELLIAALFLGSDQMGVRVLTTGQPFDELTLVCERIKPRALVLVSNHVPTPDFAPAPEPPGDEPGLPLLLAGDATWRRKTSPGHRSAAWATKVR